MYGDYADPDDWGSGGALGSIFGGPETGAGGGLMRLAAATLKLDGQVLANGIAGGSGGGIYVAVTTLQGAGSIRAAGGDGPYGHSGAGGGGRIAVYAADVSGFDTTKITAPGGASQDIQGGAGTVWIKNGRPHTHVRAHSPAGINNGYVNKGFDFVQLSFNKPALWRHHFVHA